MRSISAVFGLSVAALAASLSPVLAADGNDNAAAAAQGDTGIKAAASTAAPIDIIKDDPANKDAFGFDYGVPKSPALALIGTNESLAGSSALKPLAIQLPAEYGGTKGAQSFAADFSPAWLINQHADHAVVGTNSFDEYIGQHDGSIHFDDSYDLRLEDRFRLGASLYMGDTGGGDPKKAKDSRLAAGFSIAFADQSDPLAANIDGAPIWATCVDAANAAIPAAVADTKPDDLGDLLMFRAKFGGFRRHPETLTPAAFDKAVTETQDCFKTNAVCARHADDAKALKNALGEHKPNLGDEVTDILSAIDAITKKINDKFNAAAKPFANAADFDACVTKANAYARFGGSLDLGGGVVWDGRPGAFAGFSKSSGAVWLAGRYPIKFPDDPTNAKLLDYWLVGGTVRASWGETVATGNATTPKFEANVVNAWLGLQTVSENFELSALGGYKRTDAVHTADAAFANSGFRWQVAAGARLPKVLNALVGDVMSDSDATKNGSWITVTYGSAEGTVKTLDDKELLVTLSFAPNGDLF